MTVLPLRSSYAKMLDDATLRTVLGAFRDLHPDLLPIVVYKVLDEAWFGELNEEQIRQALRDAYDLSERGLARGELNSPSAFVASKVKLSLENQALLSRIAPEGMPTVESSAPLPEARPSATSPFRLLG